MSVVDGCCGDGVAGADAEADVRQWLMDSDVTYCLMSRVTSHLLVLCEVKAAGLNSITAAFPCLNQSKRTSLTSLRLHRNSTKIDRKEVVALRHMDLGVRRW